MGHYDDDYEHQADEARAHRKKNAKKAVISLNKFKRELPFDIPNRFKWLLEDLENWLKNESQ
jgi:predicted protein tyrosine phosphatase